MNARNRVLAARRALAEQEAALAEELARLKRERRKRPDPSDDLHRIVDRYRQHDRLQTTITATDAGGAKSFSERMADAVRAHEELVDRLARIARNRE